MRVIFALLVALSIAAVAGLGSAHFLTRGEPPFGGVQVGPWRGWPNTGSSAIDPYARAIVARTGALPLGTGEGLAFIATHDSAGQPLDGACTYAVRGPVPSSRAWTITVYDEEGRLPPNDTGRNGFTSHELLRDADGLAEIVLAREALPGNWLALPASRRLHVLIRLYGAPVAAMTGAVGPGDMPAIERLGCL